MRLNAFLPSETLLHVPTKFYFVRTYLRKLAKMVVCDAAFAEKILFLRKSSLFNTYKGSRLEL